MRNSRKFKHFQLMCVISQMNLLKLIPVYNLLNKGNFIWIRVILYYEYSFSERNV